MEDMSSARVIVKFKDKYENIPLPGKSEMIEIEPEHGSVKGGLIDRLDGNYTQDILYNPSIGKPNIFVKYGEVEFPKRKVFFNPNWDIVLYSGKLFIDSDFSFTDPWIFGIKVSWYLTNQWNIEGAFGFGQPKDGLAVQGTLYQSSINTKLIFFPDESFNPFLTAGIGHLRFVDFTTDDNAFGLDFGAGLNWKLSDRWGFQLEAKDFLMFDLYGNNTSHNFFIGAGVFLLFY